MGAYQMLMENYIRDWNNQDVDAMSAYYTDDVVYIDHAVGGTFDKDTVKIFLTNFIGSYSVGFKVTPTFVCEDPKSERLAWEWDVEGTSKDGKTKMFIRGVSMVEFRGDKIKRNVDYWDWADSPLAAEGAQAEH